MHVAVENQHFLDTLLHSSFGGHGQVIKQAEPGTFCGKSMVIAAAQMQRYTVFKRQLKNEEW